MGTQKKGSSVFRASFSIDQGPVLTTGKVCKDIKQALSSRPVESQTSARLPFCLWLAAQIEGACRGRQAL